MKKPEKYARCQLELYAGGVYVRSYAVVPEYAICKSITHEQIVIRHSIFREFVDVNILVYFNCTTVLL